MTQHAQSIPAKSGLIDQFEAKPRTPSRGIPKTRDKVQ